MIFYVDGKELVMSAGDPPIVIHRGHVHGFTASTYFIAYIPLARALRARSRILSSHFSGQRKVPLLTLSIVKGESVTFKESTQPAGTFKALFFQDMFQLSAAPSFLMVMRVFYDGDTYVSLPGGFKMLDYLVSLLRYPRVVEPIGGS